MYISKEKILDVARYSTLLETLLVLGHDGTLRRRFEKVFNVTLPKTFLYHGSNRKLNFINPNVSRGGENRNRNEENVYASDCAEYAIFLAVLDIRGEDQAGVYFDDRDRIVLWVSERFGDGESRFVEGFLYVFGSKDFSPHPNHEFTSSKDVFPTFYTKVTRDDLKSKIIIKSD